MAQPFSTYLWPGRTQFGYGAADWVGTEVNGIGATSAFVLADPGVIGAGLVQPVLDSLAAAGIEAHLHDDVVPNPDTASVDRAISAFRKSRAGVIVGVGGGSTMDTAKAVRLGATGPAEASIIDYALRLGKAARPTPANLPPMIAIPTTAGTGAEVTPWAVLTDVENHVKYSVGGHFLLPTLALIDPGLTLTLPAKLTAATGLDALSHCIEAYVSTNENPALDPMILHGIGLLGRYLPVAVAQPTNREARYQVMLGAMIGGIAISSRWLGACHALAHQLSSLAGLHHGVAIALMLPHQMRFSAMGAPERYAAIAAALDAPPAATLTRRAESAADAVADLIQRIGLPTRLTEAGVSADLVPTLTALAQTDVNLSTNPRTVSTEDVAALYRAAL
jgi:alcohol dehydrogenase class IV